MQSIVSRPEELFLKLLKNTLVFLMGLALFGAIGLSVYAGIKYSSKPVEPIPAKSPPKLEINSDPFVSELERLVAKKDNKGTTAEAPRPKNNAQSPDERQQQFMNYATSINTCSKNFAKLIGHDVSGVTAEDDRLRSEVLADALDASERRHHLGSDWGPALVAFTCETLQSSRLVDLKKKNAGTPVLISLLDYHREKWIENKKFTQDFINSEIERVDGERRSEAQRIADERAQGWFVLGLVGALLGVFALLALYLIFARIELNLRTIAQSLTARDSSMLKEYVS